jgi:hypothetical protein
MANREKSKNFLNIYQGYYQNYSLVYDREEARRRAIIDSLQVMGYDRDTAERVYSRWRRKGSSTIGGKLLDIAENV